MQLGAFQRKPKQHFEIHRDLRQCEHCETQMRARKRLYEDARSQMKRSDWHLNYVLLPNKLPQSENGFSLIGISSLLLKLSVVF